MPSERLANRKLEKLALEQSEKVKCKAYYELSNGMQKLLCERCDKYGNVTTEFGKGVCKRYR